MNTHRETIVKLSVLLASLAACSDRAPDAPPRTLRAEVRMRGLSAGGGLDAVLVAVKDFVVTTPDGKPLPTHPGQRNVDLARAGQAWLLGTVDLPADLERVRVAVKLDDYGGWQGAGGAGALAARNTTLRFDAPLAWLAEHRMATVALDLDASLVDDGPERRTLVPRLRIEY